MVIYLVGGYVRDSLLGLDLRFTDKDYLVVGATIEEMLSLGYKQVGKSFPVFLHPKTHCEYALARIEKKTGQGHKGFSFIFHPQVTLEEDLIRRDFTINALAQDINGNVYDFFGGREDLNSQMIRHVSSHFSEDPLRVIRAARFSSILGFKVAKETMILMKQMVSSGELLTLSKERIMLEIKKVIKRGDLKIFQDVLMEVGAWQILFGDEIVFNSLEGVSAKNKEIYFYFNLSADIRLTYPLPVEYIKKIQNLSDFALCLDDKDWGHFLAKIKIWNKTSTYFDEMVELICIGWGQKWQDFTKLRENVLAKLSLEGLDNLEGKAYGDELKRRQLACISDYLQANPLI